MTVKAKDILREISRLPTSDKKEVYRSLEDDVKKQMWEEICEEGWRLAKKRGYTPSDIERILAKVRAERPST